MNADLKTFPRKTLVGSHLTMSIAANRAHELWSKFMPRRSEISGINGENLYDINLYPNGYFNAFDPGAPFEKWAAVETSEAGEIPENMDSLVIDEGQYAVFTYRGPVNKAQEMFEYIFKTWLPNSPFDLDDRPHINVIGKKYKNQGPDSEEEFWIPVRSKRATNV